MEELNSRYGTDKLSRKELEVLQRKVNCLRDSELEANMRKYWMEDDIDFSVVDDARIDQIKKSIDAEILASENPTSVFRIPWNKLLHYAAILLLPIFVYTTFYFYQDSNQLSSLEMVVSTGVGEYASITLPDGTKVSLNSQSKLTYIPKTYNKKERNINFDGEAYFEVAKDKNHPFIIDAKGLQVKVLGTVFNLYARKQEPSTELFLQEGKVLLTSTFTRKGALLFPHQKAVLDQKTGAITVNKEDDIEAATAWMRKELVFRNQPLRFVLQTVEKNYGVKVKLIGIDNLDDLFTGTLPATNLNEDMEILESSYHFRTEIKGKEVVLYQLE